MKPTFFATPAAFRSWLKKHHAKRDELLVGFYKRDSGRPSITWPESVDQALAFGWIDGIRKRVDDVAYTIRFTPRRATSTWSAVNIRRVAELQSLGLMEPAGLAAFARRSEAKSGIYAYEQAEEGTFTPSQLRKLKANRKAWAFFQVQAPWYRRRAVHRVISAKRVETQLARLDALIALWNKGVRESRDYR